METETKEILLLLLCFGMLLFGVIGWSIGEYFIFTTMVGAAISIYALFRQKASYGAKVTIIEENFEGRFFYNRGEVIIHKKEPKRSSEVDRNAFLGGTLELSLIFYNEGDETSIVTIKSVELPNQNFEPIIINDGSFTIDSHEPHKYAINEFYFKSKDHILPSSIDKLRLVYTWNKKGKYKIEKKDIQIKCEILPVK